MKIKSLVLLLALLCVLFACKKNNGVVSPQLSGQSPTNPTSPSKPSTPDTISSPGVIKAYLAIVSTPADTLKTDTVMVTINN